MRCLTLRSARVGGGGPRGGGFLGNGGQVGEVLGAGVREGGGEEEEGVKAEEGEAGFHGHVSGAEKLIVKGMGKLMDGGMEVRTSGNRAMHQVA